MPAHDHPWNGRRTHGERTRRSVCATAASAPSAPTAAPALARRRPPPQGPHSSRPPPPPPPNSALPTRPRRSVRAGRRRRLGAGGQVCSALGRGCAWSAAARRRQGARGRWHSQRQRNFSFEFWGQGCGRADKCFGLGRILGRKGLFARHCGRASASSWPPPLRTDTVLSTRIKSP